MFEVRPFIGVFVYFDVICSIILSTFCFLFNVFIDHIFFYFLCNMRLCYKSIKKLFLLPSVSCFNTDISVFSFVFLGLFFCRFVGF